MKVKDLIKFMLLPSVVVVYDENQNYLAWITEKLVSKIKKQIDKELNDKNIQ